MHIIYLCAEGHSPGSGSVLWVTVQIPILCYGPQRRPNFFESYPMCIHYILRCIWICTCPCNHLQVALYPHACGCVSMYTWPCMYPCGHVSMCKWLRIHIQNLVMCYVHMAVYPCAWDHVSTWPCIHEHMAVYPCAEFGYVLWTTAQNVVMH